MRKQTASLSVYSVASTLFYALAPLSFVVFMTGDAFADFEVMLAGVTCLFIANIVYACLDLRNRLLFLFLHCGIALFLLSRPVIAVLAYGSKVNWYLSSPETTAFALTALYLSMLFLLMGTGFCGAITSYNQRARARVLKWRPRFVGERNAHKKPGVVKKPLWDSVRVVEPLVKGDAPTYTLKTLSRVRSLSREEKMGIIRFTTFACFLVCVSGALAAGAIKLSFMAGRAYTEYYLNDASGRIPWILNTLSVMTPYMMCAFLATMPRRRTSCIALVLYICTSIPMLIIGSRSDFAISFLFAALYFVFRSLTDKNEKWITRRLVICCAIALPAGIVAMGLMDYMRAGKSTSLGFFDLVLDALYKQGVSFTILGRAYDVNDQIQALGFKFFSIGRLTDTFTQGFIGQTFFGFTLLPSTNSAQLALEGWSYAHTMSFFAHWNYLGGEGYGSSYILETFADFGYPGIACGSFVIACGIFCFSHALGRSWFWGTCALISSLAVFHMPRGYADEWFSFLVTTRFWLAIVLIVAVSAILAWISLHADMKLPGLSKAAAAFRWNTRSKHTKPAETKRVAVPQAVGVLFGGNGAELDSSTSSVVDRTSKTHRNKLGLALVVAGLQGQEMR